VSQEDNKHPKGKLEKGRINLEQVNSYTVNTEYHQGKRRTKDYKGYLILRKVNKFRKPFYQALLNVLN
jgi:hypothetical protein